MIFLLEYRLKVRFSAAAVFLIANVATFYICPTPLAPVLAQSGFYRVQQDVFDRAVQFGFVADNVIVAFVLPEGTTPSKSAVGSKSCVFLKGANYLSDSIAWMSRLFGWRRVSDPTYEFLVGRDAVPSRWCFTR